MTTWKKTNRSLWAVLLCVNLIQRLALNQSD
uniref:Uncharacterized protein n=2 Tax=unclassified Caudoviricetes TaxID=2788787 RepID=A0A8S5LYU1_9CAUD|nr:MAG TPA: hypothetical protein [Siphoviridae sp. ctABi4]DAD74999.1 MAG TPA: hypothetical protein [Siphoviridae sp. ctA995]DAH48404.1 MAG TPA: hypothetical protein [Caudoviricetes sp.]DAP28538.1 MAG TPA: hypothetical protein [Bacteriophage sp.]DAL73219.1 MAG TPA: hypothetical protein [Caudoviricetes sp.]